MHPPTVSPYLPSLNSPTSLIAAYLLVFYILAWILRPPSEEGAVAQTRVPRCGYSRPRQDPVHRREGKIEK